MQILFKKLLVLSALMGVTASLQAEPLVQSGQKVAFMGDSITQFGAKNPSGYVNLVKSGLAANGIDIEVIPAGISGNESTQMLGRLKRDVLEKKPDWMTLSCGVNDVWHQNDKGSGVLLPDYQKKITEMVDQCQQAGIKVMILTSTPIMEVDNDKNQMLVSYNAFLKDLAKERGLPLADLNTAMWAIIKSRQEKGNYLTGDGVHMNPLGDMVMATGVLEAFGLDQAQIDKAKPAWEKTTVYMETPYSLKIEDFQKLSELATARGQNMKQMISTACAAAVKGLLAPPEEPKP